MKKNLFIFLCIATILVITFLDLTHTYTNALLNLISYLLIFYVGYSASKKRTINPSK